MFEMEEKMKIKEMRGMKKDEEVDKKLLLVV